MSTLRILVLSVALTALSAVALGLFVQEYRYNFKACKKTSSFMDLNGWSPGHIYNTGGVYDVGGVVFPTYRSCNVSKLTRTDKALLAKRGK